jgi:hypothetical protein
MVAPILTPGNRPQARPDGTFWIPLVPKAGITIPQYIEGLARKTMRDVGLNHVSRQVKLKWRPGISGRPEPVEWYFVDDPTKTPII